MERAHYFKNFFKKVLHFGQMRFFKGKFSSLNVVNPFAPEPPVTALADPGPFYPL